jgi:hypothetical protein
MYLVLGGICTGVEQICFSTCSRSMIKLSVVTVKRHRTYETDTRINSAFSCNVNSARPSTKLLETLSVGLRGNG